MFFSPFFLVHGQVRGTVATNTLDLMEPLQQKQWDRLCSFVRRIRKDKLVPYKVLMGMLTVRPSPQGGCRINVTRFCRTVSGERGYSDEELRVFFFLCSSLLFSSHFSSPSPSLEVTQVRGTKRALLPLPTTARAFIFYREKTPAISSRVDSHRVAYR